MATSIVMPALEMAQETGKIVSWLKKEGDAISKGEPILEIETDKAVVEVEAAADGVLAGVKSQEGDVVPVGVTIAWIVAPGETPPADSGTAAPSARKITGPKSGTNQGSHPEFRNLGIGGATPDSSPRAQISPKARRLAKEQGVDLGSLKGSGPAGTIISDDVLAGATSASATLSAVARLMAERTTQSWTQVPHFFLVRDLDATALLETREKQGRDKVTITDLLVSLTARVLKKHPKVNASWVRNGIHLNPNINISLAMAVTDGVVGAVIPNADAASLPGIAQQRKDLTERARGGRLKPSDVANGTFTITNLGMYNVDAFSAIILPPQAAILAVGRIADRVVAVDGKPAVRPMMTLTLSGDHRVIDGAQGAMFLNDLAEAIRKPAELL
ncbi:MAG TPA: dihydrolipoamide acetyltransferase family protein [Terriglobia bacterium]|jgi:pyruvate dehydrogenase E2 component (dihydrolipoamide acetyltransferase)